MSNEIVHQVAKISTIAPYTTRGQDVCVHKLYKTARRGAKIGKLRVESVA